MLNIIEKKMVLSNLSNAMKTVERHDEERSTISAKELLNLSQQRFILMQDIFSPLRKELSKSIVVKNMYFGLDAQNVAGIYIVYEENGKEEFFVISKYDLEDKAEISYESGFGRHNDLVFNNEDIISRTFELGFGRNFEKQFDLQSTSKSFVIRNNSTCLSIMDKSKNNHFEMEFKYSYPNNQIEVIRNLRCAYPNILTCLKDNEVNLKNFMNNVRVYKEDVKFLVKK